MVVNDRPGMTEWSGQGPYLSIYPLIDSVIPSGSGKDGETLNPDLVRRRGSLKSKEESLT